MFRAAFKGQDRLAQLLRFRFPRSYLPSRYTVIALQLRKATYESLTLKT